METKLRTRSIQATGEDTSGLLKDLHNLFIHGRTVGGKTRAAKIQQIRGIKSSLTTQREIGIEEMKREKKGSLAEARARQTAEGMWETVASSAFVFPKFSACRHPCKYSGTSLGSRPGPPMMGEHSVKVMRDAGLPPHRVRKVSSWPRSWTNFSLF